jgi:hypothetical protein
MKKVFLVILLVLMGLSLISCAAGTNEMANVQNPKGEVAGFWQGLWHGIISPVTFIISLFNHNVNLYEVHNNGGWYNFGFIIGVSIIFGGSGGGAGKRARKG